MEKLKRYLLLITADEWNHDADEWLGIYISDKEVLEAYNRSLEWYKTELEFGNYCDEQRLVIYEFDVEDAEFKVVDIQRLEKLYT